MARYEIYVTYKPGIFDPPGATAERALVNLGYEGVHEVKIGKFSFAANSKAKILGESGGMVKFVSDAKYDELACRSGTS